MSDNTVISSLITSGFSIGVYILYKLVKRYKMRSRCDNQGIHIDIDILNNISSQLEEHKNIIKSVISTINQVNNEEVKINIPPIIS